MLTGTMTRSLTEVDMDLSFTTSFEQRTFFELLNMATLQDLTISCDYCSTVLNLLNHLSSATALKRLKIHPIHDREVYELDIPTLPALPSSLTDLSIVCHIKDCLVLPSLPTELRRLEMFGVKVQLPQLYQLTQLEQLSIDVNLIRGQSPGNITTKVELEEQVIALVANLPVTINTAVITGGSESGIITLYDMKMWLKTRWKQQDIRATVADMLGNLMDSYYWGS